MEHIFGIGRGQGDVEKILFAGFLHFPHSSKARIVVVARRFIHTLLVGLLQQQTGIVLTTIGI
jgi:hypothetical protein